MSPTLDDRLTAEVGRGGRAYVRNLALAEAAVPRGQFNLAKVLRALAHAQRAQAMAAARLVAQNLDPVEALRTILAELEEVPADGGVASAPAVRERALDIARRALASLAGQSDVTESDVAQSVWGCHGCGYLVEGDRPDACPACGALAPEFAWFGPFYSSTAEHLGQLRPSEILATLAAAPDAVEAAVARLDEARLRSKPSREEWCVKEIVGHMLETDLLFGRRVRATLEAEGVPNLDTPVPPWKLQEGQGYEDLPVPELLGHLRRARSASLALVRDLRPEDWARGGLIRGATTSLLDLGTWLANHDRGHLAQIRRRAGS
jgi:rubrerythrin